jgi:LPS export ABC transporter protein LptC
MSRLIFSLCSMLLLACTSQLEDVYVEPYTGPMMTATNIRTIYSDSGNTKLKLEAPLQLLLQNNDREFPEGVYVEFFDEKKEPKAVLTSNYAIFYQDKNLYKISGNVIIDNQREGKKMSTEELFWSPATKKIYTDKFLTIKTANEVIKGEGLDANQDFSSYTIRKVTGIVSVK